MSEHLIVEVDLYTLKRVIGGGSYKKGRDYARQQAVRRITWDAEYAALRGTVRGEGGRDYYATAFFSVAGGWPAKFARSRCTCDISGDCKHVVALVFSAMPPERTVMPLTGPLQPMSWGQSLEPWPGNAASAMVPLAIELRLTGGTGRARRLAARPVQQDQRGDWVDGNLSWGNLDVESHLRDHAEQQVQLLRDLYRLYQEPGGREVYDYDRWIDFSAIGVPQLWPLLDEAAAAGLPLVYRGTSDVLPEYREARFHLDVADDPDSGLRITPLVLTSDQEPAVPVALIGANGQGVVCVDRAEVMAGEPASWRFWLARLARPIPSYQQEMALAGRPLEVPADEEPAFRELYFPSLRRDADLISLDGSFVLPSISEPELVLRLCPGPDRELEVSWQWAYQVGGSPRRAPLGDFAPDGQYRNRAAEGRLLARLDLPVQCYRLGFDRRPNGQIPVLAPRTRLTGQDALRFVTELLPRLSGQPGLIVEVSHTPAGHRETGVPLRITASTDEAAGNNDWFGLDVTIILEEHPVPFRDVFVALYRGEPYLQLPGGARLSLNRPELRALARLIEEACALNDPGPVRTNQLQAGLLNELSALSEAANQAPGWREQVEELLAGGPVNPAEPPAGLGAELRPYQLEGFGWLAFLWRHRLGGILADEMGLGKTLQCLALISHARQQDSAAGPFLIVAPTSVMANWVAEAAWFTPDLNVERVACTTARLRRSLGDLAAGADAVVTSYDLLRMDFDAYAELGWSGLLLDEAQRVKNRQSKIYQCALRLPAPVKIAITGTPLENNLMELWSLLSITAPGLFSSPDRFCARFAQPIEDHGDDEPLVQLQGQIRPLVVRRTKNQVAASLPAKQEEVLAVDLHEPHRHVYQMRLHRVQHDVMGLGESNDADRSTIIRSLTLLRRLSLHAGLVDDAYADLPSAKIDALLGQLHEMIAGGHRALVFSQFTGFLGKVRSQLEIEGMPYCYLDGATRNRAGVIRRFKASEVPVFLISLKAGGTGLNLTEADRCFLLDPWWNPATEAQAIDRIHRIGQTRNVKVYRLVARDTVEEKVLKLQARKAQLFSSVMMDDARAFGRALDADDLLGLLS